MDLSTPSEQLGGISMVTEPAVTRLVSIDEAIRILRDDPSLADVVRDSYLGRDVADSARRFAASAEFHEVCRILDSRLPGSTVLDVGAGTGIASWAMLQRGAGRVIALEPDPSDEVGFGALARLDPDGRIERLAASGEEIPLPSGCVDIVYARQVLHHVADLDPFLTECARVLRPGGLVLACREHVVDDAQQLAAFLAAHPVHRLAGGENAYSLPTYVGAFRRAGLRLEFVLGPWESTINAFPEVRSEEELKDLPRHILRRRLGRIGGLAAKIAPIRALVLRRVASRREPGRLHTFVAVKGSAALGDGDRGEGMGRFPDD